MALGTEPLTPYSIGQLWLALGFYWELELAPKFNVFVSVSPTATGQEFSACASKAVLSIQTAAVKFVNEMIATKSDKWDLDFPALWDTSQELDFRS